MRVAGWLAETDILISSLITLNHKSSAMLIKQPFGEVLVMSVFLKISAAMFYTVGGFSMPWIYFNFRKTYDPGRGGEGGGIDYTSFCATRTRGRKRHYGNISSGRHWDRYGYPERQRNVRPRYNPQSVPPPPPPDYSTLKSDFTIPQSSTHQEMKLSKAIKIKNLAWLQLWYVKWNWCRASLYCQWRVSYRYTGLAVGCMQPLIISYLLLSTSLFKRFRCTDIPTNGSAHSAHAESPTSAGKQGYGTNDTRDMLTQPSLKAELQDIE